MQAKCVKYGDDISTDLIIAGKYTKTLNLADLAAHAMEDLDPLFHEKLGGRGIVAAGSYFGCGSSREQAPVALKESGVLCVVAKSFSRIFYRNAVNIGLPIFECDTDGISDGDILEFDLKSSVIKDVTTQKELPVEPMPDIMVEILNDGGIVEHFAKKGGF